MLELELAKLQTTDKPRRTEIMANAGSGWLSAWGEIEGVWEETVNWGQRHSVSAFTLHCLTFESLFLVSVKWVITSSTVLFSP